jgi:hypothetical protein
VARADSACITQLSLQLLVIVWMTSVQPSSVNAQSIVALAASVA